MDALEELARFKPRENAGARASNRLSYQKAWSLKKLLELEEKFRAKK